MSSSSSDSDASFKSAKSQEEDPPHLLPSGRPPPFPPNLSGPSPRNSSRAVSPHLGQNHGDGKSVSFRVASTADDGDNDWGSFEFSDTDFSLSKPGNQIKPSNKPSNGVPPGELLRLRGESSTHGGSMPGKTLKRPLIGIYADPAAKKDDWANDFDLEIPEVSHPNLNQPSIPSPFMEPFHEPRWPQTRDSPIISTQVFNRLNIPKLELHPSSQPLPPSATSEYAFSSEDGTPLFALPNVHPPVSSSPVVKGILGYDSPQVHQGCAHLKELFARHSSSIQQHVDGVIAELGNHSSVDQKALAVLLLSSDVEVSRLSDLHKTAAPDLLEWKLELSRLMGDQIGVAKSMLGLAQYASVSGNILKSQEWLDDLNQVADTFGESSFSMALRIEADYGCALNERHCGNIDKARSILDQAVSKSWKLISMRPSSNEHIAPSLRGIWWSLRCKFLLAELCREQNQLSSAIQHYSEFSVECIARMLGLIAPNENEPFNSLPWYFLFSPRSLVTAIWSCTRCLFELRALSPAVDMASVTMNAATLFGNKNVNDAAAELRTNAKAALREYKRNQAASFATSPGLETHAEAGGRYPAGHYDQFDQDSFYRVQDDFASVESEEDWDQTIAQELNIKIERCSTTNKFTEGPTIPPEIGTSFASVNLHGDEQSFFSSAANTFFNTNFSKAANPAQPSSANVTPGPHSASTGLMEAELRLYLNRIHGSVSSQSVHQLYPKPTVPFDGVVRGVKEHEAFLRNFVREKDPRFREKRRSGWLPDSVWDPTFIDGRDRKDPMMVFRAKSMEIERLSSQWATLVLETVWNILRGDGIIDEKRANIRSLLQTTIREAAEVSSRIPVSRESDRIERLDMLASLLQALKLSREILTRDGAEAAWFSRTCTYLGNMASKLKTAAKAAVELFQAESRAHCGVTTVIPPVLIRQRANEHSRSGGIDPDSSVISQTLRQSVVDTLHALFWRTKSGFDENSSSTSLERLVHADVAATLFLTGCGVSSVDGSTINVVKDESVLFIHNASNTDRVLDETRRVTVSELVQELQNLWASLPSSASVVRAKLSFALAIHSEVAPHDYGRTEQFLFDGLQALHSVAPTSEEDPVSFFSTLARVSPISIVSMPLSAAMLHAYSRLALRHLKYRYGIAALEAASDCRRVQDLRNVSSLATAMDVATAALSKGDWRRALVLLYDLRSVVHPKDDKRDDFIHLCLLLHQICLDVGCFSASIVPLRAFSALIYEERLRVLLLPNRRRLARKSRDRRKFHSAISPLPTRYSKAPYLKAQRSSLAVLFESPDGDRNGDLIDDEFSESNPASTSSPVLGTASQAPSNPSKSSRNLLSRSKTVRFSRNGRRSRDSRLKGSSRDTATMDEILDVDEGLSRADSVPTSTGSAVLPVVKSRSEPTTTKNKPKGKPHSFEEEQKELVRIEAEQESIADAERFKVEFLLIKTAFLEGRYDEANSRCQGLLEMKMPPKSRLKVCEVRAKIALKRRAIIKCLELIDGMERDYRGTFLNRQRSESNAELTKCDSNIAGLSGTDDSSKTVGADGVPIFIPSTTFLRLSALLHGGRLAEGLNVADESLKLCPESELWNRAKLHYLRGKILYAISSISTAPFDSGEALSHGLASSTLTLDVRSITLTLSAFETASQYYDAAGDEIGMLKSDLLWARTCIDTLFRRVVLPFEAGGGIPLETACALGGRTISPVEVEEAVHHVIHLASTANLPILLIDAIAALAEIKCIRGEHSRSWNSWVTEGWRLFSRFFTDSEDFRVVLTEVAPVSTLIRVRNLCGRLVRLVLCGPKAENVAAINRHIHMFEAYVTLQVDIDRRMNLTTASQKKAPETSPTVSESDSADGQAKETPNASPPKASAQKSFQKASPKPSFKRSDGSIDKVSGVHKGLTAMKRHYGLDRRADSIGSRSRSSRDSVRTESSHRPAGAFLHMLGSESAAFGRMGLSMVISRPRKHVFSAVIETGAVLIPSNFFTNSRVQEKAGAHVLGKDAELIFPFNERVGLGAMQILDGPLPKRENPSHGVSPTSDGDGSTPSEMAKKKSNRSSDSSRRGQRKRGGSSSTVNPDIEELLENEARGGNVSDADIHRPKSVLLGLVETIRAAENCGGGPLPPEVFGSTTAERVWAHYHRIKAETKRYVHGALSIEELGNRNREAVRSWMLCCPNSKKEWTVPESIAKRLVYVLLAHGVLGYYVVDAMECVFAVAFGGKQPRNSGAVSPTALFSAPTAGIRSVPRPLTDSERSYLFNLVKDWKRGSGWYKDRDSSIINGLAVSVLRAPRTLLATNPHSHKKSRPIVLIADTTVQVMPWELCFDHVVIRSHCLIDVIRGVQEDVPTAPLPVVPPGFSSNRSLIRFICFTSSRREGAEPEKSEEARRQHFALQSLLRLNHLCATSLNSRLGLGRFSDPTAMNAMALPTGALSTPLSQSRKAGKLLGVRFGQKNYPHLDFLKVPGLGTASTTDLKEAATSFLARVHEKEGDAMRDIGNYITVFLFTYADLIGQSQAVFGLTRSVPRSILMFTPATQMKVLARHLEDVQLTRELDRGFRGARPDFCACARTLVEYVSRFSRDKRIPIVVFLGEGLSDVFPRRRVGFRNAAKPQVPVAQSLFQRPPRAPQSPFR